MREEATPGRRALPELAGTVALALATTLLLLLLFSPEWVAFRAWWRVPELYWQGLPVRRGAWVAKQVADPSVEITDPLHAIVRWRLLMPMVGHLLGLAPAAVLALSYVGCAAVLAVIVRFGRVRAFSWRESAMLAAVVGSAGWFFASTGWLGYFDSWLVLGLLAVAWADRAPVVWAACLLTPWIDERFVLGLPLAILVRWASRDDASTIRRLAREAAIPAALAAAYVVVRLRLAGDAGSPTLGAYWQAIDGSVPASRYALGAWEGTRAGWLPVLAAPLVLARRRRLSGTLLGAAIVVTTLVGLASANDLGRSVAPLAAVVPFGWQLAHGEAWWTRWRVGPVLAGAALLVPAHHVVTTFTVPIERGWHEARALADPPPEFSASSYLEDAERAGKEGNLAGADSLTSVAVRLTPSATTHNARGAVLARLGHLDEARRELDAAVALDPRMTEALMNRARVSAALGDEAAARHDATNVLELAPPDSSEALRAAEFLRSFDGHRR